MIAGPESGEFFGVGRSGSHKAEGAGQEEGAVVLSAVPAKPGRWLGIEVPADFLKIGETPMLAVTTPPGTP